VNTGDIAACFVRRLATDTPAAYSVLPPRTSVN
jgi:hypothetical protein